VKFIAFIFLFLVAFFTVQPLISSQAKAPATPCCSKMTSCHPMKQPSKEKGECKGDACNPFLACSYCNFYLLYNSDFIFIAIAPLNIKKIPVDDNRLSAGLSESWHPPQAILSLS